MAKAKVLKIPARGEWEFAEVAIAEIGNLTCVAMKPVVFRVENLGD